MKSNTFIKNKLSIAIAIAVATSSVLLVGCNESTTVTEDSSRIEVTEANTLTSYVRGIVQDTNGNPVVDAQVSIGGIDTTTDSAGAYVLNEVPVTGVEDADGIYRATSLQISIKPSNSYLSATVSVTPSASTIITEVVSEDASDQNENQQDSLLSVIIFDGMSISAGTTVIPAIGATVTGVLRDSVTGIAIANTVVALEVIEVNGIAQQQAQNTTAPQTSYGTMTYQAATDDMGNFMFENLPEDTDFDIIVEGYQAGINTGGINGGNLGNPGNGDFATTPEVAVQYIGDIDATPISSNDDVSPFVASVNGVVEQGVNRGMLNDGIDGTQGIVINFSEPLMANVSVDSVFVVDTSLNMLIDVAAVALSADGLTLTVTTGSAITQGSEFEIGLNVADFEDGAGNNIDLAPGNFNGLTTPGYTSNTQAGGLSLHSLALQTYKQPVISSSALTVTQVFEDTTAIEHTVLRALSNTFIDVDNATTGIQQLNSTDDDDNNSIQDTADRIKSLASQTVANSGIGTNPAVVEVDQARVSFDVTTATVYTVTVEDMNSNDQVVMLNPIDDVVLSNNGSDSVTLKLDADFSASSIALILDGVSPSDEVTITPMTDFDTPITASAGTVVLLDKVAATPVIQNSYGQGLKTAGVADSSYGDGGELSMLDSSAVGAPFLNITPRLIVPQATNSVPLPVSSIWDALTATNVVDVNGDPQVDVMTNMAGMYTGYDATAMAAWTVGSRNLGIAFSEDIAVTGTPSFTSLGATTLTNYSAQNDVMQNDQGVVVNADLVNVEVNDVISLANTDDGVSIDFDGAIQDLATNTTMAEDGSLVIVRDLMPPMAQTAFYNGDTVTITFNETVSLEANDDTTPPTNPMSADQFVLRGMASDHTISVNQENESSNQNTATVTLDLTEMSQIIGSSGNTITTVTELNKAMIFDRGTYDHDGDTNTADVAHAIITSATIRDDNNGTSWANWDNGNGSVKVPAIVIQDTTGEFTAQTPTSTGFTATSTSFTVTYTFSHRVDLQASGLAAVAGANQLSGTEVATGFALTSTALIDAGTSSATLSSDGKTLIVTVGTDVGLSAADTFAANAAFNSAWDQSAMDVPATPAVLTVP